MAATKLDGAGAEKMKTIEEALIALQTINGMVERMAIEIKRQGSVGILPQQIKRNAAMLQGQLKGQFGAHRRPVSPRMVLVIGRGGGDSARLRALRESVAQIRTSLETRGPEGEGAALRSHRRAGRLRRLDPRCPPLNTAHTFRRPIFPYVFVGLFLTSQFPCVRASQKRQEPP